MTDTELITQVINHTDNVSATDSAYSDRRTRIKEYLQETVNDIRQRLNLPMKRNTASLTVTSAAANVIVPSDFSQVGHNGGVYLSTTGDKLDWVPEQELMGLRQSATTGTTAAPDVYSIFDTSSDSDGTRLLLQFPPLAANITVTLDYEVTPPTMTDSSFDLSAAIPAEYHQTVLMPFVRALAYESKGDNRADVERARGEAAFRRMAIQERRGKETTHQLRSFFGR